MEGAVDEKVAAARHRKLMAVQRPISRRKMDALVGRELEVLVEGVSDEHELVLMGRHGGQAPEIDGQVYLSGTEMLDRPLKAGDRVEVAITQSSDYDLAGDVLRILPDDASAARRVSLRVVSSDNRTLR